MDDQDFALALQLSRQRDKDFVDGAEYFIRLKKMAYVIDPSDRTNIPKKDFAQPNKEEEGHEGKYPIPDRQHARSALGFAKMHHDTGALSAVEHKIEQKYPDMLHEKKASRNLDADIRIHKLASTMDTVRQALAKRPMLRSAVIGGAASGAFGAGMGAMNAPPGDKVRSAIDSGVTSGAMGAGAGALIHHLQNKLASVKTANAITDYVRNIDPVMATSVGLGAVGGALLGRHANKPRPELGGKSKAESELEDSVEINKKHPEDGLLKKIMNRNTEQQHGYAKAFREHPTKATLISGLTGAGSGYLLGRLGGAAIKRFGGH
jgi:hypothetical protein